jgi:hypothetical protein
VLASRSLIKKETMNKKSLGLQVTSDSRIGDVGFANSGRQAHSVLASRYSRCCSDAFIVEWFPGTTCVRVCVCARVCVRARRVCACVQKKTMFCKKKLFFHCFFTEPFSFFMYFRLIFFTWELYILKEVIRPHIPYSI